LQPSRFDSKRGSGILVVETVARIRREHFAKGKTIREIARDLGVSRNTVERLKAPAWFTGKLVSLATRWDELNHHVQASGQLILPF
jgi:DNA-binding transcriptional regulator LsrR (DeoR family)